MLNEICEHLHNFFDRRDDGEYIDRTAGTFTILNGLISPLPSSLIAGQYIRIVGSLLNDGIYLLPSNFTISSLVNETFTGAIFGLSISSDRVFLTRVSEITAYVAANPATGFVSESFGGWSGTRATGANGAVSPWQIVYEKQLNRWRKMP
jgi:hypothetical protein